MLYNDGMAKKQRTDNTDGVEYQGLRVWAKTNRKLKIVAALRGESIIALLDRLADDEMARLSVTSKSSDEKGA